MNGAGTLEVVETAEHLEFALPCDVPTCAHDAVWATSTPCCSASILACAECKRASDGFYRVVLMTGGSIICTFCRAENPEPLTWTPIGGDRG